MSEERDDERQGTRRSSRWGNAGNDSNSRRFDRASRDDDRRNAGRGSERGGFNSERRDDERHPYGRERSSYDRSDRRGYSDGRRNGDRGYGDSRREGGRGDRRYDSDNRGGYRGGRRDDSRGRFDADSRGYSDRGGRFRDDRGQSDGGRRFDRDNRDSERRNFGGREDRGFRNDRGPREGRFSRDRSDSRNFNERRDFRDSRETRSEGSRFRDDRGGRDSFSRGGFSDSRSDRGFDRRSGERRDDRRGENRFGERGGRAERDRFDERRPSRDRGFSRDERRGSDRFSNDHGFDRNRGFNRDGGSFGEGRRERTDQNQNVRGPRSWDGPMDEDGRTKRKPEPWISEEITGRELDKQIRQQLRTLSKENADGVARHLVAATELLDVDPKLAFEHAEHAASRAGRVPAAREILGLAYYRLGQYAEALREFRTARRLSGSDNLIPLMVDCERGLGRYERALELANSPEASRLSEADNIELAIVVSGVRRDMGQARAALVGLRIPALTKATTQPWAARLFYAYADTLMDLDEREEAREWFVKAEAADADDVTDAGDRIDEIDGFEMTDLDPEEDQKVDQRFADFDLKQPFGAEGEAQGE